MKLLEDKLEDLDVYFTSKKESEKWVMIFGLAGIIGYIAYAFLLPYTEELHKKSEHTRMSTEKSIKENNLYLNSITKSGDRNFYIKKFDNDILLKKKNIVNIQNKTKFINSNLEKLSDLLFNQKSWSIFLNSITQKAEINNVNLKYIDNTYTDSNGSFGHVLELSLGTTGTYKNIVKFMNELEQNVLVTDIYETDFQLENNSSDISADIHISVWGINH